MPPRRKLSSRQLQLLVEFAEDNPQIAFGRFSAGPLSSQAARQAWNALASRINSVADGTTKTPDQWRRYWIEFKAKTKTKAADIRRGATATGGGPNKFVALTEIEQRVLALIGPVAVEGLPGVRIPFIQPIEIEIPLNNDILSQSQSQPSTSHAEPIESPMHEEWLENETQSGNNMCSNDVEQPIAQSPQSVSLSVGRETRGLPQPRSNDVRRRRAQRLSSRNERIPHWAYDLETRRIAAEERHATAMERLVTTMETGVNIFRDIFNELKIYMRQNNS